MPDAAAAPFTGFPASTKVHTPDGLVPIGQLRAGDLVRSTDVTTGESGDWPVLETHALPGVQLGYVMWFDGEDEGWCLAGRSQRFWVTTNEPEERFRIPYEGAPPTGWRPVEGWRSTWGTLRGWVELDELCWGDQWIVATQCPAALGFSENVRIFATDRERVAWVERYHDADEGAEFEFDAAGAITGIRNQVPARAEFETRFTSPTRQLTVERGHAFRVHEIGLLAADHVNPGGPLMATPPSAEPEPTDPRPR